MTAIKYPVFLLEGKSLVVAVADSDQLSSVVEENDVHFETYSRGWDSIGRPLQLAWVKDRPHIQLKHAEPQMTALLSAITRYAVSGSGGQPFNLPENIDPSTALQLANEHIDNHTPPTWLERLIHRIRHGRSSGRI